MPTNIQPTEGNDIIYVYSEGFGDRVDGLGGDDEITGSSDNDVLIGGSGNDRLTGMNGNDWLYGDAGQDWFNGFEGNDIIDGGSGHDIAVYRLDWGTTGTLGWVAGDIPETFLVRLARPDGSVVTVFSIGRYGTDSYTVRGENIAASQGTDVVTNVETLHFYVIHDPAVAPPEQTVVLTASPIVGPLVNHLGFVTGSIFSETINLGAIYGEATAADIIDAVGGLGNDHLLGNAYQNMLAGDEGNDTLDGYGGDDTLEGGEGNDTLDGGGGYDSARFLLPPGTTGTLRLVADVDPKTFLVQLVAADGSVQDRFRITENSGVTTVTGLGDTADLFGTDRLERVEHLEFSIEGSALPGQYLDVNLAFRASPLVNNFASVEGSIFYDSLNLTVLYASAGNAATLSANGGLGNDTIVGHDGVNFLTGGAGNDSLSGLGGNDNLNGGHGDDSLAGGDGDDFLDGNFGDDALDGGAGFDTAGYAIPVEWVGTLRTVSAADGAAVVQFLAPGAAPEDIGRLFRDNLGNAVVETLNSYGDYGVDTLSGMEMVQFSIPGGSQDPANYAFLKLYVEAQPLNGNFGQAIGSALSDTIDLGAIYGTDAALVLNADGGLGNDTIFGHGGGNLLWGREGNDVLHGGGGNDFLDGGVGNDALYGDGGIDVAQFVLPKGTSGTLQLVYEGPSRTPLVQLLHADKTVETLFRIARDPSGDVFVEGVGRAADFGTDRLIGTEWAQFVVDNFPGSPLPSQFLNLPIAPVEGPLTGGFAQYTGTIFDETIDLTAIYPQANPSDVVNAVGGAGNDTIIGTAGNNFLYGNEGDDSILGGDGHDTLQGQEGNDTLEGGNVLDTALYVLPKGSQGAFHITTQPFLGAYEVSLVTDPAVPADPLFRFSRVGDVVTVQGVGAAAAFGTDTLHNIWQLSFMVDNGPNPPLVTQNFTISLVVATTPLFNNAASVTGSYFDDVILLAGTYPTAGANVVLSADGGVGDDFIAGHIGNDVLTGNIGNDTLVSGAGNDYLVGSEGNDSLSGQDGSDTLIGGLGDDLIDGGTGFDVAAWMLPADPASTLRVVSGTTADTVLVQRLVSNIAAEALFLVTRDSRGLVTVTGQNSAAGQGTDLVTTAERLSFSLENAGAGQSADVTFTYSFGFNGALNAQVVTGTSFGDSFDVTTAFTGVATITAATTVLANGNLGNDTITGHAGVDFLNGNDGDDALSGDGGNDVLNGGPGNDGLDGGDGIDTASYAGAPAAVAANLYLGTATGGDGNDGLIAIENLAGSAFADMLIGGGGDNALAGNGGNDTLVGGGGNDTLVGGAGNDTIDAGGGTDVANYAGARSAATVTRNGDRSLAVATSGEGTDALLQTEQVKFSDGLYSFTFARPGAAVVANFNPAFGWASQNQYPRHVADMNGDGYGDVVGFGISGVLVSYGAANGTFSNAAVVLADFGQNAGWANDNQFHRIVADVNGDGRADIIGFGFAGTLVSLARADGSFTGVTTGLADFGVNQGWANQNGFARVVGDVNGDGKADIVGFGFAGALVALGNGNGTFQPVKTGIANFGVNQGWTSDTSFHRELADVNGDGRADLIGFGIAGTYVALGQADGTFATANLVLADFGANQGWTSNDSFSRLVADVNGDHIGDIVGFGIAGTLVAFGKGDGTFTQAGFDVADFGANQGWTSDNTFHREVADMNKDGLADLVGFGIAGVLVGFNQGDFLVV